ncbi:MAG TPA: hypothetical protein VMY98_03345 [Anaerolineae bacterium]|nr:hypothetical protein [Anaerolineae bacterium]
MPDKSPYERKIVDALEIRNIVEAESGAERFGCEGYSLALFTFENDLDQTVTFQVQGRAWDGTTWQDVGAGVAVTAGNAGTASVTAPWGMLQLTMTAGGVPTTGSVSAWMNRAR